jgi:hypothetical protein
MDIPETMRQAIVRCGKSRYRIAKDTGLDVTQLCKFMKGQTGLSIASLTVLADYLDLEIIIRPRKRKPDGKHQS